MNRNQVLKIIADHRETLARDFGVKSLALFGSVVRDEANAASDVDLLVEFDDRPIGLLRLPNPALPGENPRHSERRPGVA
jgi:predicted nucleotidyltransferase